MLKSGKKLRIVSVALSLVLVAALLSSCAASMVKTESLYGDLRDDYYVSDISQSVSVEEFDSALNGKDLYYSSSFTETPKTEAEYNTDALTTGTGNPLSGHKIIRTVNIESETKDFANAIVQLEAKVALFGGYIQTSNIRNNTLDIRYANYTIRIPAESLDEFMGDVDGLVNVVNKKENVDDVTDTYLDIEARLTSLKTQETRLLELLEAAKSLDEVIKLEDRLSSVRYDIESYTARLISIDRRVDFSTVNITVREVVDYTPVVEKDPTFGERVKDAFTESWKNFADGCKDIAVFSVYSIPTVLIVAVAAIVLVLVCRRALKKRSNRKISETEE